MWLREVRAVDDSSALTTDLVAAPGAALHVHDSDYATVGGTGTVDSQAE